MEIIQSKFITSSAKLSQLPPPKLAEFAFVGRSNVGKSSFINCLCQRKSLAKTSSTPGKTQLINHFLIDESWYLVDLPGYGYAKVSKTQRASFLGMITDYLTQRESLMNVFVLIDSRIKPQAIDLEFLEFLGMEGLPFVILWTKTDKLNQKTRNLHLKQFKNALLETWEELPLLISTSSVSGRGRKEVLDIIEDTLPLFNS